MRERTEKSTQDTCFSSCSTPKACQRGRKSSPGCFLLKSSGGRRAWATLCTYLWYWSPERVKKKKKERERKNSLIYHSGLSCSPSQGFVKTLPASSADCTGTLKPTVFNCFYRITSRPVGLHVAMLHLATRRAPHPPENDTDRCLVPLFLKWCTTFD